MKAHDCCYMTLWVEYMIKYAPTVRASIHRSECHFQVLCERTWLYFGLTAQKVLLHVKRPSKQQNCCAGRGVSPGALAKWDQHISHILPQYHAAVSWLEIWLYHHVNKWRCIFKLFVMWISDHVQFVFSLPYKVCTFLKKLACHSFWVNDWWMIYRMCGGNLR